MLSTLLFCGKFSEKNIVFSYQYLCVKSPSFVKKDTLRFIIFIKEI